jgi:hypothetical protein
MEKTLKGSEMGESKKAHIIGWSALPSCGNEEASVEYGAWTIDSTTIKNCPICERALTHMVVGLIADKGGIQRPGPADGTWIEVTEKNS